MLNKLMLGVALSAFALSGAMAQSSPSPSTATPPSASSPSSPDSGKSSTSGAATSSSSTASSTGAAVVTTQSPDQFLASKFKGTDVVGSDDKKIGDVSDILFDKEGKIEAYVISVGGFLGVGAKDVALAPTAFEVIKGSNGSSDKLKLSMNKDELKQAQNFEPYKPPQATTGAGGMAPAGGGMRPATPPATSK